MFVLKSTYTNDCLRLSSLAGDALNEKLEFELNNIKLHGEIRLLSLELATANRKILLLETEKEDKNSEYYD